MFKQFKMIIAVFAVLFTFIATLGLQDAKAATKLADGNIILLLLYGKAIKMNRLE